MRPHDPTHDELVDVDVRVHPVPRTELVHLDVDGRGTVLTRAQAARLGRDLLTATGRRRYAAADAAPAAAAAPVSPGRRP